MKDTMRNAARAAVVLLALTGPAAAFQADPQGPNSSLEGRVVNAVTGDGIRRVSLTLLPVHGKGKEGKEVTAVTADDGRFAFRNVQAGAYRLSGERPGFRKQQHGARLNPNSGAILVLAAGQAMTDLVFKLAPDAVISGSVLDQAGEPMPNLIVSALRNSYTGGRRQWTSSGSSQTNDRGEFRIAGLTAGRYIVMATNMNLTIGLAGISKDAPGDKPETAYTSTYFGNATEVARAAAIDLRAGDDRRGTNIQMLQSPAVQVRGKVVDSPEGTTLMMMLVRKGSEGDDPGRFSLAQQDGTFEVKGVTPGSYILTARSVADPTKTAGALAVEVADKNVEGIQFRMSAGGEVSGHLAMPADKIAGAKDLEVVLDSVDFALGGAPSARPGADGRFTLRDVVPVRYRVRVRGMPEDAYVKSVKVGGQEAEEAGAELAAGAQLEIAVGLAGARVEGTVTGPGEKPMAGATVALVPDSGRESRYASTTTDEKGAYTLSGIAPGKYRLLAWEDVEPGAFRDLEFVKRFESEALSLEDGGRSKVALKAIPFEKVAGEARAR